MNMKRKLAAVALCGTVALAGAAGIVAAQALAPSSAGLLPQAQAKSTKAVYVLATQKAKGAKKVTYTYNSKGLLTRAKGSKDIRYGYNGKDQLVTIRDATGKTAKLTDKLTYSGKGYLKTASNYTYKKAGSTKKTRAHKNVYSCNSKGQVSKIKSFGATSKVLQETNHEYNSSGPDKGLLRQVKYAGVIKSTLYTYDTHGYLIKVDTFNMGAIVYDRYCDNTYDSHGNLVKRTYTTKRGKSATYTYKKVQVPSKYAKQVKEQQKALIDPDVHFVFPQYA